MFRRGRLPPLWRPATVVAVASELELGFTHLGFGFTDALGLRGRLGGGKPTVGSGGGGAAGRGRGGGRWAGSAKGDGDRSG